MSRGIYSSSKLYLVLVHCPTWWIPPLRFATVGMTYLRGGFVYPLRLSLQRGGRLIAAPTYTSVSGTVHPHGLYSSRRMAMNHRRYIAWFRSSVQTAIAAVDGDGSSPPYYAIPFIYTDSAPYLRYFRIMKDAELEVDKQGTGGYD